MSRIMFASTKENSSIFNSKKIINFNNLHFEKSYKI